MGAMKRAVMSVAICALLAGCGATDVVRPVTGKVIAKAEMTAYEPDAGTSCTPQKSGPDVAQVVIHDSAGRDHLLPAGNGVIRYRSGTPKPGEQWCELTFTGEVPDTGSSYTVGIQNVGSITVSSKDLFSGVGIVVTADSVTGGVL